MKNFLKLFILVLSIFNFSFAENFFVKSTEVKNLPKQYGEVFNDFLLENLENSFPYKDSNKKGLVLVPYISWIGISYNICFDIYNNNYIVNMECFSSMSGEEIVSDIYELEKDIPSFKLKKLQKKEISLKFKVGTKPIVKRLKIISPKGDILVNHVPVFYKTDVKGKVYDLGAGNLNLDTLILNYQQSKKLFELLLKNYHVEEILIIK